MVFRKSFQPLLVIFAMLLSFSSFAVPGRALIQVLRQSARNIDNIASLSSRRLAIEGIDATQSSTVTEIISRIARENPTGLREALELSDDVAASRSIVDLIAAEVSGLNDTHKQALTNIISGRGLQNDTIGFNSPAITAISGYISARDAIAEATSNAQARACQQLGVCSIAAPNFESLFSGSDAVSPSVATAFRNGVLNSRTTPRSTDEVLQNVAKSLNDDPTAKNNLFAAIESATDRTTRLALEADIEQMLLPHGVRGLPQDNQANYAVAMFLIEQAFSARNTDDFFGGNANRTAFMGLVVEAFRYNGVSDSRPGFGALHSDILTLLPHFATDANKANGLSRILESANAGSSFAERRANLESSLRQSMGEGYDEFAQTCSRVMTRS